VAETRKLAAILVSDVVGYSRLAGSDEDRTLARLRALRSDLIDPIIAVHNGRVVKRTGDGAIVEFRSVVDAVRCAIEVLNGMVERNAGLPPERRIEFRVGIHLGDVVEESDGDLMGDGVNIAARLQGIAEPGAICLSEDAYRQVKSRLDLAVSDLGSTQLKNIAEPMHVYSLEGGKPAKAKPEVAEPAAPNKRLMIAAGVTALIVIAAAGAWYLRAGHKQAVIANAPAHLSIVVLPFRNLSGDPSQDYFADGITENLTTDLSRIRNSFVIARNTAFTFKGMNIPVKEVSKELGVRYVLEGSVQRDQNHVRVNAQLIDGETGAHLWADRFGEDIADVFKLQDQVVARLANTLGYELVKAEAQRGTHSTNPDAIDMTMRGWAALWQPPTMESITSARDYFEHAIKLDPQNAEAIVGLAYARLRNRAYGWSIAAEDKPAAQIDLLTKATAINPGYAFAYYVKSVALWLTKEYPEALAAAETEVALDPNSAYGYAAIGRVEGLLGRCEQSITHIKQAFALSPRDPYSGFWYTYLGLAEFCRGRLDAAIGQFKRAISSGYPTYFPYAYLAGAEAAKGNDAEAKLALVEACRLNPQLTIKWLRQRRRPHRSLSMACARPGFRKNERLWFSGRKVRGSFCRSRLVRSGSNPVVQGFQRNVRYAFKTELNSGRGAISICVTYSQQPSERNDEEMIRHGRRSKQGDCATLLLRNGGPKE
jgi:adenylate cyclase